MAETTTVTYQSATSVHQDGEINTGTWQGTQNTLESISLSVPGVSFQQLGIIFDLSSLIDGDNPIMHPNSFTLYSTENSTSKKTWDIYALYDLDPADFAGSGTDNEPYKRRVANGGLVCKAVMPDISANEAFTFKLGQNNTTGSWVDNSTYLQNWAKAYGYWRSKDSAKKVCFVLEQQYTDSTASDPVWHAENATDSNVTPSITVTEWSENTGHNKAQPGDRAVYDMRTGRACGASELQEDGYHNGIWVLDPDPEDSRRRPIELPDTERQRQDEVPT